MELPPSDAAADIRRTNVEREATYLEFARLEAAAKRRVAERACIVRDALASTPALGQELERRGIVDDDEALGKLASGLMAAPLSDPPEGTAEADRMSAHDVADVLRELYGGRRAEHGGVAGELAARRKQLEKRQRDLLRERDRLAEHERVHELTLEERRKVEAATKMAEEEENRQTVSSSEPSSSSDDESEYSDAAAARAAADAKARAKASPARAPPGGKLQRQDGRKGRPRDENETARVRKMSRSKRIEAQQDALRPTRAIAPRRVRPNPWDAGSESSSASSSAAAPSPFALPEVAKEALAHGDREALVRRLQKELGVKPKQKVTAFVPTRAKDRLLRMKLAHSSVAARLKYLESAASYEKELRDGEKREEKLSTTQAGLAEYAARLDDTREPAVKTVEQMCRELALELCGGVADVLAERPTKEKLAFEKREWTRRAGSRRVAMCRQTLDALVREVAREEAMGVVLEVEANHAAAAGFVAKAIAGAVMARLDGDAAAELKPWAPPPPPETGSRAGEKGAARKKSGGWLWSSKTPAEKAAAKAAKEKAKAEKAAKAKAKKAARDAAVAAKKAARKNTRWSLFGGSKPRDDRAAIPENGDETIDFRARLAAEVGSSSEECWSTSSSDEEDDFAYDTAVGRHACQHMLNEMQRRRPPGLVFHHTQPLRPASPPPGIARGAEANSGFKETKDAATPNASGERPRDPRGDDADASSSESGSSSSGSSSSDSDSDSEAAVEKRRVAAALEKQRRAAEAEAKAKMQPPPRSGVANLGVLAEPPPPSQAHRAALAAERRYWRAVRVARAFGGKDERKSATIEVKKGAVTSMATAKSGRSQVLAAGSSKGELVVWKFSAPDASSDEDEDEARAAKASASSPRDEPAAAKSPGKKKLGAKAETALALREAKEKEEAALAREEKRRKKTRAGERARPPAVVARAECSFHPELETQEEDVAVPSAAYTALTSVSWSADASQLCTAERGGSSRMWSLAPTSAARGGKAGSGKLAIGETMVLAPVNHTTSSPTPDPSPPPPPDAKADAGSLSEARSKRKTKEELIEELAEAKEAAREAAKARLRARERWPREAQTLTRFFPAFTLAGRQPFAMFARPNGDIVRASPTTRPAAISDAISRPPLSGKIQRELAMFRGSQTWARSALFAAVERGRARALGADDAVDESLSDDGEYDGESGTSAARKAGASTFVPTRRLDNAELYREGKRANVPGSPFVAGVDRLLDLAETFASGAGEHMGGPERDLLLAPDVVPALPGAEPPKERVAKQTHESPYAQDVYRGHAHPVVFLDVLPDSGSLLSVDADGLMCLWSAFQGDAGRSGFGWFSPLGTWRLPAEVTAQVPSGFPVEVGTSGGGDGGRTRFTPDTHAPWLAWRVGKLSTVVEAPVDPAMAAEDENARRAVAALSRPRTYGEQLELEPTRRVLDIPGVDPDRETPEQKWARGAGEVGDLDPETAVARDARNQSGAKKKTSFVIPEGETRDYFVSQYDDDGRCVKRLRQLHVTRRAAAPVVGAVVASDGGVPDLVVIRRVSGACAAALKAGGVDAALASAPYFTAHTYSLDSMTPTAPRMDMPNPFLPPKGRGALDARRSRAKPGAALERTGALAARGWADPAPYPFALAKSTPATGSEHLVVPTGARHVGVFSIATGAMTRDFGLPGVPEREGHLSALKVFDSPHPTAAGRDSLTRSLLAAAVADSGKIFVFALDESAAQILGVDSAREAIARAPAPTPRVGRRRSAERRVSVASASDGGSDSGSGSDSDSDSDADAKETKVGTESACVRLRGMTTRAALLDDAEARELVRDTRDVCSDFGKVAHIFAPRPGPDPARDPPGVGELFLRFETRASAAVARKALDRREFDGNVVRASFVAAADFEATRARAERAEAERAQAKYKSSSRARAAEKTSR